MGEVGRVISRLVLRLPYGDSVRGFHAGRSEMEAEVQETSPVEKEAVASHRFVQRPVGSAKQPVRAGSQGHHGSAASADEHLLESGDVRDQVPIVVADQDEVGSDPAKDEVELPPVVHVQDALDRTAMKLSGEGAGAVDDQDVPVVVEHAAGEPKPQAGVIGIDRARDCET
jgi:hypothetical protein